MEKPLSMLFIFLLVLSLPAVQCPSCGGTIDDDAHFCPYCGSKVEWGYVFFQRPRDIDGIYSPQEMAVNGVPIDGRLPHRMKLQPGKYTIEYRCEDRISSRNFGIVANDTSFVLIECYARNEEKQKSLIYFRVIPKNAKITVNGGNYSVHDTIQMPGGSRARLSFSAPGNVNRDTTITLLSQTITSVQIELNPVQDSLVCIEPNPPELADTITKGRLNIWGIGLMAAGVVAVSLPAATADIESESGRKHLETCQIAVMSTGVVSFLSGGFLIGSKATRVDDSAAISNRELLENYKYELNLYRECLERRKQIKPPNPKPFEIYSRPLHPE